MCVLSHVRLSMTPWTVAHQASLPLGFPTKTLEWVAIWTRASGVSYIARGFCFSPNNTLSYNLQRIFFLSILERSGYVHMTVVCPPLFVNTNMWKYLYISPIYRKPFWGLENSLFTDGENLREMPSVYWLKTAMSAQHCASSHNRGCSAEWALVCQDSKRSCLLRWNKALTDRGICRVATQCVKPMFPPPHCRVVYRNGSSHLHV